MPKINNPQNFKGEDLISVNELPVIGGYDNDKNQKSVALDKSAKIDFIGDCTFFHNSDGSITVRIGPNLNHSQFGQADGSADYKTEIVNAVTLTAPTLTNTDVYTTGTASKNIKLATGVYSVDTKTASGKIHCDQPSGFAYAVEVKKDDASSYFIFPVDMYNASGTILPSSIITGYVGSLSNGTYSKSETKTGANTKLTISSFAKEPAAGSTGYCYDLAFKIDSKDILGTDPAPSAYTSTYDICSVTLINNFDSSTQSKTTLNITTLDPQTYYWGKDTITGGVTDAMPDITDVEATVQLSEIIKSYKTRSGVTYFTNGALANTVKVTGSGLEKLYVPFGPSGAGKPLKFTANDNFGIGYIEKTTAKGDTTCTWDTALQSNKEYAAINTWDISGTVKNYNSNGVHKAGSVKVLSGTAETAIVDPAFRLYTCNVGIDASIDESSSLDKGRVYINETSGIVSAWYPSSVLQSEELMLDKQYICVPKNYSAFNNINNITNPDYSAIAGKAGVYYIAYKTTFGTSQSAKLTIEGSNVSGLVAGNIFISPDPKTFAKCDAFAAKTGSSGLFTKQVSKAANKYELTVSFDGNGLGYQFTNTTLMYIKIQLPASSGIKISKITLS